MDLASIIIPCYNEEATISNLLSGLYDQTYGISNIEIIIADGSSCDGTREKISKFAESHTDLRLKVIDNPKRTIPAGLNLALSIATGEFIIRLDAHSFPAKDYIEKCVSGLKNNAGDNVGGIWIIKPGSSGWVAESIAKAASSSLGVGDANYRIMSKSGEVDTVPFGAFKKLFLQEMGGFDETLLTNEDYELNTRIRKIGGKVWLDNSIKCTYFARNTYSKLARQYWRYGFWKAQMLKRYPESVKWRQALPPLFVLGLIVTLFLSILQPVFLVLLLTVVFVYLFILVISSWIVAYKNHQPAFIIGMPIAISIMHVLWGAGLLSGLVVKPKENSYNNIG